MEIKLWDKGYVKTIEDKIGCKYNEINLNKENRIKAVTSVAAISRGKDKSNNPEKRYQHLLKEAAPNISFYDLENAEYENLEHVAGRPLEFCPVVLDVKTFLTEYDKDIMVEIKLKDTSLITDPFDFNNKLGEFSYIVKTNSSKGKIYTNLRAVYNYIQNENKIPFNKPEELEDYFIAEVKAPYFVFAQLRTHGLLSQVAVSERVVDSEELWLPEDIIERLGKLNNLNITNEYLNSMCKQIAESVRLNDLEMLKKVMRQLPVGFGQGLLKQLGYKKEIYQRFYNHMLYKTWIIGGYLNNPYQWGHFLLEREAYDNLLKSWVQPQTKEAAKALRKLILDYLYERDSR